MIGQFSDVETIVAFKDLLNRLNCDNLDVRSNAPHFNADFRSSYLMNSMVTGIDETDLLILVGTNPKTECPVLNARIRKAIMVNGLEVVVIGAANNLQYNYRHLGNSAKTLKELADGTHPYSERLAKANLPMVIVGSETLTRSDGSATTKLPVLVPLILVSPQKELPKDPRLCSFLDLTTLEKKTSPKMLS